ncbi:MAG: molybdate transport system ATP-binding protein [Fusobacteriaceae bacterium]|jgi:molybdate transport system ATP-binding protein|nr:cysA [Fusobacteriales bacterium]MDN5304230.1 molybdate transport system ATP-binding protein [Fusobacteriaceae bacterium]
MLDINLEKNINNKKININFKINNEIVVLKGKSGAGKTTILNCISGFDIPEKGYIKINNEKIFCSDKGINHPVRNREIGYIFQNYGLFPHMKVKENIYFGLKNKKTKNFYYAEELINKFGITHLKEKYPSEISGGEKQRVAIIRTLVTKPKVLLMDEPFSALDEDTKEKAFFILNEYRKENSLDIVLVTHNNDEIEKFSDKIINI